MLKGKLYGVLFIFTLALMGAFFVGSLNNPLDSGIKQGIDYSADVCVYTTGDFEGRETPAHSGELELVNCDHNLLYSLGRNMTRDCLVGGCGAITNITLCNETVAGQCDEPVAGATEDYTEFASCGLGSFAGTVASYANAPIGNWSISNTFTSSCAATQKTNVTRLINGSGQTFAGNSFTVVSLENNDQITVNWTIGVS